MRLAAPVPLAAHHDRSVFSCGQPALDHWLAHHAGPSQAAHSARVFASIDIESGRVAGYYALAAGQIEPASAPPRLTKGQPRLRPVPVVILARLAVDHQHQGCGLGSSLLRDALMRTLTAAESIGIRAVLVHAKDAAARAWYQRYEFIPSPSDSLHLVLLMKDLERLLTSAPDG